MNDLPEYVLDRAFDAPRDMVWKAWTTPELLARWYGPGIETKIHKFDFKPGGLWLNEMIWGGNSNYSKMAFRDINPVENMTWDHHSCTDENWNDIANPMMKDWPRLLDTAVVFSEDGAKTNVRLTQIPMQATDAELACFTEAMSNMDNGWGGGYKIIDEILAELQA